MTRHWVGNECFIFCWSSFEINHPKLFAFITNKGLNIYDGVSYVTRVDALRAICYLIEILIFVSIVFYRCWQLLVLFYFNTRRSSRFHILILIHKIYKVPTVMLLKKESESLVLEVSYVYNNFDISTIRQPYW